MSASFWRFWAARTAGIVGDQLLAVALAAHVYALHHDASELSAIMLAFAAPRLLSPFCGALADNLDARSTMIVVDLASVAVLVPILLSPGSFRVALLVAVLITTLSTLYLPAGRRSIEALTGPDSLPRAYALIGTSWNLGWALGPALGGVLLLLGSIRTVCLIDGATFLGSAVLIWTLPRSIRPPGRLNLRAAGRSLRQGTAAFRTLPIVRLIGLTVLAIVALASIDAVLLLVLVTRTFAEPTGSYGLLVSVSGVGMIVSSAILSARPVRRFVVTILGGQLLLAAGLLATAVSPNIFSAATAQFLAGFGTGGENVASGVLIQRSVPREVLGTVSGILAMLPYLGNVIAYSLAPVLLAVLGVRLSFAVAGLTVVLVSTTSFALMRRTLR